MRLLKTKITPAPILNESELLSCVWLFATLWTVAYQAPPSMGFSRRKYWSGLPLPSPVVFPTFFYLSLNFAIRSSWPELQSASGLVFAECIELLHLQLQRFDFGIGHLMMSMDRVISWVAGKECLLWPACFLDKILLAFALLHFVIQGQTCLLLQVFLDFLLSILIPKDG